MYLMPERIEVARTLAMKSQHATLIVDTAVDEDNRIERVVMADTTDALLVGDDRIIGLVTPDGTVYRGTLR